jgi:hypothetical protein
MRTLLALALLTAALCTGCFSPETRAKAHAVNEQMANPTRIYKSTVTDSTGKTQTCYTTVHPRYGTADTRCYAD